MQHVNLDNRRCQNILALHVQYEIRQLQRDCSIFVDEKLYFYESPKEMDHHKVLCALTTNEKREGQNFEESLRQIVVKVTSMLPKESQDVTILAESSNNSTIRARYLKIVLYVLKSLRNSEMSNNDTFMSVNQQKTVKAAVEIAVSIGILPCLFPGVGAGIHKMCPRAKELDDEGLTDLQKFDRLSLTVRHLTDFWDEPSLRLALLPQLGPLLGGLLQLSYAPLAKPSSNSTSERQDTEFRMTTELYERLTGDQLEFRERLSCLIDECPLAAIVREFMVILGVKEAPKWIRRRAQSYLVRAMVRPNGILALIDAVCGDAIDLGAHWNKLDTVARLVASSQGDDPDEYYEAVCSQLLELLTSKSINHSTTIATNCITALYEHDPPVCIARIFRAIVAPLRAEASSNPSKVSPRSETEVSDCVENLTKCFVPTDAKFKHPPCTLLREVALPLFTLYVKSRGSVSLLQTKIRDLLIHALRDSAGTRDDLFTAFLDHETNRSEEDFGAKLSCEFGPTGGLEITGEIESLDHEIAADSLFDLLANDRALALDLFNYLLRSLASPTNEGSSDGKTNARTNRSKPKGETLLETSEDTLDRMGRQLATMKLLSRLAEAREIQEAQLKNPRFIVSFVESLFDERAEKRTTIGEPCEEDEKIEVLYVSLMLIKVILTDGERPKDWSPFKDLAAFLTTVERRTKIPQQLASLVDELLRVIANEGKSRRYQDLSVDDRGEVSEFGKALKDLADPLLPVRAHGLIALTKLLEKKDAETLAKKDIVRCFFQENLKDDDSFVYLSAVNGLCALASVFPNDVIETLVQEYIDMPQRTTTGEISPEVRAKLGEILVKTTRSLGEMCSAHKNILINGFLCGCRDADDMVRASSLSCLGEICKVMGFRLGHAINEIIYCIGCVISTDKSPECRRAAVLVATLLIRGLGKDTLTDLGNDLVPLYRALKFLRDNDDDHVLRLHAQLALEELDDVVQTLLFSVGKLEKRIFLLP